MNPLVLIVEDEGALVEVLKYNLEKEGFRTEVATDGEEALLVLDEQSPDLVILDWMLPHVSGIEVCRRIRRRKETRGVPIVMLTARGEEGDRVRGLESGADDYVTKPFSMRELVSRVRAALRRAYRPPRDPDTLVLEGGPVTMDIDRHEVRVGGELVGFRPKEFELLESLMVRKGRLVTRQTLLEEVWGMPFYGDPKTLDVHIRRLREKVESEPRSPEWILTVRGLGYKFSDDDRARG